MRIVTDRGPFNRSHRPLLSQQSIWSATELDRLDAAISNIKSAANSLRGAFAGDEVSHTCEYAKNVK